MGLNTGELIINNKEIYHGMNSGSFMNIFSSEVNTYANGDIERYNFKNPHIINELSFWIRTVFKKSYISSIELKNADPKLKNSYENWSEDKVEIKRKSHDEWLINQLGHPTEINQANIEYNYSWGEVLSYYDPRSGDIGIIINYYEQDK